MEALLVGSSVLILFVILLRIVFGRHISFRMRYALWLIVVLRLAWPFALPGSPLSIMNYVPSVREWFGIDMEQQKSAEPVAAAGLWAGENREQDIPSSGEMGEPVALTVRQGVALVRFDDRTRDALAYTSGQQGIQSQQQDGQAARSVRAATWKKRRIVIWLTGAVFMSLYLLIVNMIFYLRLRKARVRISLADRTEEGWILPVYCCENLASPCLFGVRHPAIYLNGAALADEKNRAFAMAHEQQHYRHKDHIWSLVRLICLTIYWFHPLVWAAAILSARDCELACDEGVTAGITDEECAEYGRCLLSQVPLKRGGMRLTATTSMSGSARNLKRRLVAIMHKKKNSVWAAILTAGILLLVTGCTFTGAKDRDSKATGSGADVSSRENEESGTERPDTDGNGESGESGGMDGATAGGEAGSTDGTAAGNDGTDESGAIRDSELLVKLEESIRVDESGALAFRIPISDHAPEDWTILIYGRIKMGDGYMSQHFLEPEQAGHAWESGRSFSIMITGDGISEAAELSMDVTLSSFSEDGEETQTARTIDLLERCQALTAPDAGENMMQAALRAYTMFSDGWHGWALTQDNQVLYTYEGAERFSYLNDLPFAGAGEADDGMARFRADSEAEVSSCFLDEKTAFFAGVSADDGEALIIRETIMEEPAAGDESGRVVVAQHSTRVLLEQYFPNGNMFISFSDAENGYLLVCSDPALGQMAKHLYRTTDGGDSFSFTADLSDVISGYPTGMAFCSEDFGYIGVSHRGEPVYLYGTADGGGTWESIDVPVHTNANYADALAPVLFYAGGKAQIALVLKDVGEEVWYTLYQNHHAAEDLITWELIRVLPYEEVKSYSFMNADTGYFIDADGILQEWNDEFP